MSVMMTAVELLAPSTMPVMMTAVELLAPNTMPVLLQEAMEIVAIEIRQISIQRLWKVAVVVRCCDRMTRLLDRGRLQRLVRDPLHKWSDHHAVWRKSRTRGITTETFR